MGTFAVVLKKLLFVSISVRLCVFEVVIYVRLKGCACVLKWILFFVSYQRMSVSSKWLRLGCLKERVFVSK